MFFQQGIALITALLIVAIATVLAVALTSEQQLSIRRTANLIHADQAYQYALGAEKWARRILLRDKTDVDSLEDNWAIPLPAVPITGGFLQGQLTDLQGRFNLNALGLADSNGQVNQVAQQRLRRLLRLLELPENLTEAIADWVDADREPRFPDGAEDDVYLLKNPAYRTGNTPFVHISELRLVAGVDEKIYQTLLPYVTVLPVNTPINVNTAPLLILLTLGDDIPAATMQQVILNREDKIFPSIQTFLQQEALAGLTINTQDLSVNSSFFELNAQVQIDNLNMNLFSVLHRFEQQTALINRRLVE